MSEAYVIAEEPYFDTTPGAVGNGMADDTAALQHHINLMAFFLEPKPLLLSRKYKLTAPLTIPAVPAESAKPRVKLQGFNRKNFLSETTIMPSTLMIAHAGHGIVVDGEFFEMEGLHLRHQTPGSGDVYALWVRGAHSKITWNQITRAGGTAGVRIDKGGMTFEHNYVNVGQNPPQWSYDPARLGPARGHALYLQSMSDSLISHNELSGEGGGLFTDACAAIIIHDNFVYNSMEGIVLQGMSRCSVHDNRVDENYRQGIVIDWNTSGCTIHDNVVNNNGAWIANPNAIERAGMVLRSGLHNNIHGNQFDNWDHNVTQAGDLDFRSPQQYGLVVQGVGSGSQTRPLPAHNLVMGNVFRDQRTAPLQNNGDATNKFIGNTGSQFPNGLYADPTPQTVTAGLTGPAAAVAAGAAGLVALRNRGSRANS